MRHRWNIKLTYNVPLAKFIEGSDVHHSGVHDNVNLGNLHIYLFNVKIKVGYPDKHDLLISNNMA